MLWQLGKYPLDHYNKTSVETVDYVKLVTSMMYKNQHKATRLLLSISTPTGKRVRAKSGYTQQKPRHQGLSDPFSLSICPHLHFQTSRGRTNKISSSLLKCHKFEISHDNIPL